MKFPLAALLVLAAGAAHAAGSSPLTLKLDVSSAISKSGGGLRMAQAKGSAPKSTGEKKPKVKTQVGGDGDDYLDGTKGPDLMSGGKGKDDFHFTYDPLFTNKNSLDDGDRITDYEFGEMIIIGGIRLKDKSIKIVYDPKKNETRIEFDLPDKKGQTDGKIDRTIILTGDKRGTLYTHIPCCIAEQTEIWITNEKAAKTAKKKVKKKVTKKRVKRHRAKRSPAATHRSAGRKIRQNRYIVEDADVSTGGE